MTDNLPTLSTAALDYSDDGTLKVIKDSICPDANESEFQFFVQYCKSTRLNPFKREVWFVKTKGYRNKKGYDVPPKVQIMTGINGYLAIANSHPQFDGMEEPVFEHDADGNIVKCSVRVYRKDRKIPSTGVAFFAEYFAGNDYKSSNWDTKSHHMIAKVAKAIALREAFPQELNGSHVEEEFDLERQEENDVSKAVEAVRKEMEEKAKKEAAEAAAKAICYYDLKTMPEASMEAAQSYLDRAGARLDTDRGVWVSKIEIPKLKNYRAILPTEDANGQM
jgi:phage recombination protein Bet